MTHSTTDSLMPPTTPTTEHSLLLTGVDTLIGLLEREASELAQKGPAEPGATRGVPSTGALSEQMEELDEFVHHLLQIRDWLRQDPRLLPVVDDAIGSQVRELERRQAKQNVSLAIATTVGGAILGWVISLLGTPAAVFHLLGH